MIYDAAVDRVIVEVGGRKFWNAYRVDTSIRKINYFVNESGDPFDMKSPLRFEPKRNSLVRASMTVPRGKLKIKRDRSG